MPERIQLRRAKGWRKPASAVVVARSSRWGNPHRIDDVGRDAAVAAYERDLRAGRLPFSAEDVRRELQGRDLACWCPLDERCHADVLLRYANG
jgi:hypothetical protein